jgi:hypothetical protein
MAEGFGTDMKNWRQILSWKQDTRSKVPDMGNWVFMFEHDADDLEDMVYWSNWEGWVDFYSGEKFTHFDNVDYAPIGTTSIAILDDDGFIRSRFPLEGGSFITTFAWRQLPPMFGRLISGESSQFTPIRFYPGVCLYQSDDKTYALFSDLAYEDAHDFDEELDNLITRFKANRDQYSQKVLRVLSLPEEDRHIWFCKIPGVSWLFNHKVEFVEGVL